jgi:xanthine dehydrogenase YagT iron-sulfur-binding subunit
MMNLVCVGSAAPDVAIDCIDPGCDRPRVLAFVRDWTAARERHDDIAVLRAELRGLGAELLVLSGDTTWSFGPDDHVEQLGSSPGVEAAIARVADRFGVPVGCEAVFVIDHENIVRFAHRPTTSPLPSLVDALAAANEAMFAQTFEQQVLFTRREWNVTALVTGFALVFLSACRSRETPRAPSPSPRPPPTTDDIAIELEVNGKTHALRIDPRASLLDTLRERLGLTGTKKGCDMGQCGSCTVLANGEPVLACLTLAMMAQHRKWVTIEGLAQGDELHPMQRAFIEHDGLQCGYCTPGQILSAVALIAEGRATSDDDVRLQMSGNLCRCGAQPNIVAAIQAVRGRGAVR